MKAYCEREVEPMCKEVEQVQIIALVEYMGLGIYPLSRRQAIRRTRRALRDQTSGK